MAGILGAAGTFLVEPAISSRVELADRQASQGSMLNEAQSLTVETSSSWLRLPPVIASAVAVLAM